MGTDPTGDTFHQFVDNVRWHVRGVVGLRAVIVRTLSDPSFVLDAPPARKRVEVPVARRQFARNHFH